MKSSELPFKGGPSKPTYLYFVHAEKKSRPNSANLHLLMLHTTLSKLKMLSLKLGADSRCPSAEIQGCVTEPQDLSPVLLGLGSRVRGSFRLHCTAF